MHNSLLQGTQYAADLSLIKQQLPMSKVQFPLLAIITVAPGKGGKMTVRAFDARTNADITRDIVYITLQNAYKAGQNLLKVDEDSRWERVDYTALDQIDLVGTTATPPPVPVSVDADPVLQMIHSSPSRRPADLYCQDLIWKFICRNIVRGRNILLTGPTGTGKSQTAFAAARAMDRELFYINLGATQDPRGALIGNTHFSKDSGTFFNESAFVRAIQTPNTVVVLDEISRAHPEAWNILMTVLDPKQRYLRMDEAVGTPEIKVADGVSFIGTANIGSEYTAVRVMDRALLDRFTIAEIPFLSVDEETSLVRQLFPSIDAQHARNLAEIAGQTRAELKSDSARISTPISTRSVLEMAGLLEDGFTLTECAEVSIYPLYSQDGGMQSERTFIKQLVQKFVPDGTADNLMGSTNQNPF